MGRRVLYHGRHLGSPICDPKPLKTGVPTEMELDPVVPRPHVLLLPLVREKLQLNNTLNQKRENEGTKENTPTRPSDKSGVVKQSQDPTVLLQGLR